MHILLSSIDSKHIMVQVCTFAVSEKFLFVIFFMFEIFALGANVNVRTS